MKRVIGRVALGAVLLAVWLLLIQPVTTPELIAGLIVSALVALLPAPGARVYEEFPLTPKRIVFAIAYIWVFLAAMVRSNVDVAFRVLHPRLPINPGIVRVRTRLKSRLGRLILANSITLTPGTITVDVDGEDLYVHWLSVSSEDVEENTKSIVGGFEKYLEVIFG